MVLISGEATNTNFIVFGLTGAWPTIYRTTDEHANHSTTIYHTTDEHANHGTTIYRTTDEHANNSTTIYHITNGQVSVFVCSTFVCSTFVCSTFVCSTVDCGSTPSQTKDYKIGICCFSTNQHHECTLKFVLHYK
jgi:hypothetical protein